jgi:hypothetical protein
LLSAWRWKALSSLLKEIRSLLDPEDDYDDEDPVEDEDDADEKEIALALRSMLLELKASDNSDNKGARLTAIRN